jgi:pimeloyl-ACP methyl ester carboxylesterase
LTEIEHIRIETNGISLHAAVAGPKTGTPVILLHGYPEFWYAWRRYVEPIADRGYLVIVPDQRGYNISDKPKKVGAYVMDELAKDVVGLIDWSGRPKAHLVGHDWGGAATWWTAIRSPERVQSFTVINAPHPRVMRDVLWSNPRQLRKSWYFFFFQIPFVPEASILGNDGGARFALGLSRTAKPGAFTEEYLERLKEAWQKPGALRSMIHWYRAALQRTPKMPSGSIDVPSLVIWGTEDRFLGAELGEASAAKCTRGKLVRLAATHWVAHEKFEEVRDLILERLAQQ